MSTVLEALDALIAKASPGPWVLSAGRKWVWSGESTPRPVLVPHRLHPSPTTAECANATLVVLDRDHLRPLVAALGDDGHGQPAWHHEGCTGCQALDALRRDIEEA